MVTLKNKKHNSQGSALIITIIFLAVFSSLSLAMLAMSSSNLQLADNHRKSNLALEGGFSGLEVMRYWLNRVYMPGTVTPAERFERLATFANLDMASAGLTASKIYDEEGDVISLNIENIGINSSPSQSFSAIMQPTANLDILQLDITGYAGSTQRTIRVNYNFGTRAHTVFDFGVATKGPLQLSGNIELSGINVSVDASVYIESENENEALSIIGNSQIAGDVSITNPDAYVTLQGGQAGIGGETGVDAIDNHVTFGVPPTEFPAPIPGYFEQYVDNVYDPNNPLTLYENLRIPAGTNPSFAGGITLNGVVFIETPNVVTFTGNTNITGIIVGDGDITDNSATNQIIFQGDVDSSPVTSLPADDSTFDGLREETGTFLMAPGFSVGFGGSFETLNGAIAANGVEFFGNAGGTIQGSIINYSDTPMTLTGNSDLIFNRSGVDEVPAGFGPEIILYYVPTSYSEVAAL